MTAIQVNDLHFAYTAHDILKAINVAIPKGSFIAILGPNGSGKTTLLKNMCQILNPKSGEIQLKDQSLMSYKAKDVAKEMAVVHQSQSTDFDFTVEEVVLMGRYPYLRRFQSETEMDFEVVRSAMEATGTLPFKDKTLQSISGGEKQRVMIAKALAQQTEILLLDEPISHLDIKFQMDILKLCKKLSQENKMTIVSTLHDINMAARFADFVILMKEGRIITTGKPHEVITQNYVKEVYDIDSEVFSHLNYPMIIPL